MVVLPLHPPHPAPPPPSGPFSLDKYTQKQTALLFTACPYQSCFQRLGLESGSVGGSALQTPRGRCLPAEAC